MKLDCFVSVLVPINTSTPDIKPFLLKLSQTLSSHYQDHEIVLVDTSGKINNEVVQLLDSILAIRYLRPTRDIDIEIAITLGLDSVIGDYVVVMFYDTDPVELVPKLVSLCHEGHDLAYGVKESDKTDFIFLRLTKRLFSWVCRKFFHINWIHRATHFRCLTRQVVNYLVQIQENSRCLRTNSLNIAGNPISIAYTPKKTSSSSNSRTFFQNVRYGLSLISQNSYHPLRMATWLGIIAISTNFFYLIYIISVWILRENLAEGWFSSNILIVSHFLLFSLILTIFSEYLGTLLSKIQNKPLYSIAEEKCSNIHFSSEDLQNVVNVSSVYENN